MKVLLSGGPFDGHLEYDVSDMDVTAIDDTLRWVALGRDPNRYTLVPGDSFAGMGPEVRYRIVAREQAGTTPVALARHEPNPTTPDAAR
jgi:hypothetical protein